MRVRAAFAPVRHFVAVVRLQLCTAIIVASVFISSRGGVLIGVR